MTPEIYAIDDEIEALLAKKAAMERDHLGPPLTFDEWISGPNNRRGRTDPLVPYRVYAKSHNRWMHLERAHADEGNPRGFICGEEPVVMMGSRWAMLNLSREGKPSLLVHQIAERYVRRHKPTLWTGSQIVQYGWSLSHRIANKLGIRHQYINSHIFAGCAGIDSEQSPGFIWQGKRMEVPSERLPMLRSLFAVEQRLAKLPG